MVTTRKTSPGKRSDESRVNMVEVVLPNDANPTGNLLGGKVMYLMDIAAAIAAHRHSRRLVVTASVDKLEFLHPIKIGQLILLEAVVTAAFRTSMEVEVNVYSEDILSGDRLHTSTAYFTFVALDDTGKPVAVPRLVPVSSEEKRKLEDARRRRKLRLKDRRTGT